MIIMLAGYHYRWMCFIIFLLDFRDNVVGVCVWGGGVPARMLYKQKLVYGKGFKVSLPPKWERSGKDKYVLPALTLYMQGIIN